VLLSESEGITLIDNSEPYLSIYDTTDTDGDPSTYSGVNTLLGELREFYGLGGD
jgi:hypothetical protein